MGIVTRDEMQVATNADIYFYNELAKLKEQRLNPPQEEQGGIISG